ncbi:MAG: DUF4163 domain-containing protein [Azoarcus sp.]|jgi:hypothetical protein|nr:DUF4163 domain-containing protein [Azoarcus sp.]
MKRLILSVLLLTALNVSARADCMEVIDPVTDECVPFTEDRALLPPPSYRNERFEVVGNPYCNIVAKYPVFSIPPLDKKIKDSIEQRVLSARSDCLPATAPEAEIFSVELGIDYTVLRPSGCVLVVYFDVHFRGGGPPYWSKYALNYDLANHVFLELEDLFEDFDALKNEHLVYIGSPYFLMPNGIVTHYYGPFSTPWTEVISMDRLQPYRPIQRYWDRTGCDSP